MPGFNVSDLLPAIRGLVESAKQIDSSNTGRVCTFVAELVANGGNKTKAARAAGYGRAKDKEGKKRSEEARDKIASSKAATLLENDGIKSLYDKFSEQKFISTALRTCLGKEYILYCNYLMFDMYYLDEKKANLAMTALQEISKLEGHYELEKDDGDDGRSMKAEELLEAANVLSKFKKELLDDMSKGEGDWID